MTTQWFYKDGELASGAWSARVDASNPPSQPWAYTGIRIGEVSAAHSLELPADKNEIADEELADRLRLNKKLMNFLISYSTDENLVNRIRQFSDGNSDDITRVAYAIRNVYAHGDLTSTAIGLGTYAQQDVLWDLATFLLSYSDDVFTKCVDKLR